MSGNVASEQRLGVGGGLYLGHSNFSLSMAKLAQVGGGVGCEDPSRTDCQSLLFICCTGTSTLPFAPPPPSHETQNSAYYGGALYVATNLSRGGDMSLLQVG